MIFTLFDVVAVTEAVDVISVAVCVVVLGVVVDDFSMTL